MRELEDDLVGRVRESRFTFRTDRGLVADSGSDEGPDGGGVPPSATTAVGRLAGGGVILIPRLAGVFFLRGRVVDCIMTCREAKGTTTCVLFKGRRRKRI